jgi:hypothetical protein
MAAEPIGRDDALNVLHRARGLTLVLGQPGIGKTALLRAAAERVEGARVVTSAGAVPAKAPKLLVVDVPGALPGEQALALVRRLQSFPRAWLALRQRVPEQDGLSWSELELLPLTQDMASKLWDQLSARRATRAGFDDAFARCGGHPLWLQLAHQGALLGDDPLSQTIGALSDDALIVLALAAVGHAPAWTRLAPAAQAPGPEVLRGLREALLVDVDLEGRVHVSPAVATAVSRRLEAPALQPLRRRVLSGYDAVGVPAADLFLARLSAAMGDAAHDTALALLAGDWRLPIESGQAPSFATVLDAAPPQLRATAPWLTARAACHLRMLTLDDGALLKPLWKGPTRETQRLGIYIALLELMRCRLSEAMAVCDALDAAPAGTLDDSERGLTALIRAFAIAAISGPTAARERLVRDGADDGDLRVHLAQQFLAWQARYTEPPKLGELSPHFSRPAWDGYRSQAMWPLLLGSFQGERLGGDTGGALGLAEAMLSRNDDALSRVHAGVLKVIKLWENGERREALKGLKACADRGEAAGYWLATLWFRYWVARLSFMLGHAADARADLERVTQHARRLGAASLETATQAALREELGARLDEVLRGPLLPPEPASSTRARAFLALRAAASGERAIVERALQGWEARRGTPDYPVESLLAQLAERLLQALSEEGSTLTRSEARAQALELARRVEADPGVVDTVLSAAGSDVFLSAEQRRLGVLAPGAMPEGTCVDAVDGAIHAGGKRVPIEKLQAGKKLLYRLARSAGATVSKQALVEATWPTRYSAVMHDNTLFVTVHRLKRTLTAAGLAIEKDEDGGYRLISEKPLWFRGPLWRG